MKVRTGIVLIFSLALTGCFTTTLLYIGVASSDAARVSESLKSGADPDEVRYSYPLLVLAAEKGDSEIVEMLISNGANLHARRNTETSRIPAFGLAEYEIPPEYLSTFNHYGALCAASFSGQPDVVTQLHSSGFDVSKATPHPVLCAVHGVQPLQALKSLLAIGISPSSANDSAIMHRAISNDRAEQGLATFLVAQGIDVDQPLPTSVESATETWNFEQGISPLATAITKSGRDQDLTPVIRELLDAGANANAYSTNGESLLALASASNCYVCTVQLLAAGASLENPIWDQLPREKKLGQLSPSSTEIAALLIDSQAIPPATNSFTSELLDRIQSRASNLNQPLYDPKSPNSYQLALQEHQHVIPGETGNKIRQEVETKRRALIEKEKIAQRKAEEQQRLRLAAERKARESRLKAQEQKRLAEQRQREVQAQKQKHVDNAIKAMWDQSTEFDQLLSTIGGAKANCDNYRKLYSKVKAQNCSYMNKYRNWSSSDSCDALKKDMQKSINRSKKQSCNNYDAAKMKVVSIFDNKLEVNSVNQEIYRRSKLSKNSYRQLVQDYDDPVSTLEDLVESSQRSENQAHTTREREAWASVARAASNTNVQSHVSAQFKKGYDAANQLLFNQAALNSSSSQISQHLTKAKNYLAENPIQAPAKTASSKAMTQAQALSRNKAACDKKGGRFDSTINNCIIVTYAQTAVVQQLETNRTGFASTALSTSSNSSSISATSSSASSTYRKSNAGNTDSKDYSSRSAQNNHQKQSAQSDEESWVVRTECGNTNFDKTMPAPAEVCRNTAPPQYWDLQWHYKPYFDGIHLVKLKLRNTSNAPLEFFLRGTVSADASHRDFEWRVVVPANSTRTKSDGLDLDDVPHVMESSI